MFIRMTDWTIMITSQSVEKWKYQIALLIRPYELWTGITLAVILHRTLGADNLIRSLIHQLKLVTMNDEGKGVT